VQQFSDKDLFELPYVLAA